MHILVLVLLLVVIHNFRQEFGDVRKFYIISYLLYMYTLTVDSRWVCPSTRDVYSSMAPDPTSWFPEVHGCPKKFLERLIFSRCVNVFWKSWGFILWYILHISRPLGQCHKDICPIYVYFIFYIHMYMYVHILLILIYWYKNQRYQS